MQLAITLHGVRRRALKQNEVLSTFSSLSLDVPPIPVVHHATFPSTDSLLLPSTRSGDDVLPGPASLMISTLR